MKTVMVKHSNNNKIFWFEVPEELTGEIRDGVRVVCDTARGVRDGFVTGGVLDVDSVRDIMEKSGAVFPLRKILSVKGAGTAKTEDVTLKKFPMENIKVPNYLLFSKPSNSKIAKRFMEYYHTGGFHTRVIVTERGVLKDGYTAYLVTKKLRLPTLLAEVETPDEEKSGEKASDYKIPDDIKSIIPNYFYEAFVGELVRVFGVCALERDKDGRYELESLGGTVGYVKAFKATCKKIGMDWLADYYDALSWHEFNLFNGEISDEVLKRFRTDMEGENPYYRFLIGEGKSSGNKERE